MRCGWLAPGPPFQTGDGGVRLLAEAYEDHDRWRENESCGCIVAEGDLHGAVIAVHHWIPDDSSPHVPDPDCGCHPQLGDSKTTAAHGGVVLLYEHVDQDG